MTIPQTQPLREVLPVYTCLTLVLAVDLHALLQAILNGALPGGGRLGKGSRAAKGPGGGAVSHADDADVVGAADARVARHSLGHLDLDVEVGVCGQRQAAEADTGHVLRDFSRLESCSVGAARRAVDVGRQRTGAVLVDLSVLERDDTVVRGSGQTRRGAVARRRGDADLFRFFRLDPLAIGFVPAAAEQPAEEAPELASLHAVCRGPAVVGTTTSATNLLADVVGDVVLLAGAGAVVHGDLGTAAHEAADEDGRVDGPVALGASQGADLAAGDLAVPDDGRIGLGTAAVAGAVAGSPVGDWGNRISLQT